MSWDNLFTLTVFFGLHRRRYSALCAANIYGFIPSACEVVSREDSENNSEETRETVDKKRFTQWMEQKSFTILDKYSLSEENSIVILDNTTIYHSEEIIRLIQSTGANIIYLPPYSPNLNPTELIFRVYKLMLKKIYNEQLSVAHTFALQAITCVTANIFFHCGIPQVKKLLDEDNDFEVVFTAVVAAMAASITIVNAAATILNNIKYKFNDMLIINSLVIRTK